MCHDSWATAGIRCDLMEELSLWLSQKKSGTSFSSGVWTGELPQVSWGEGQEPLQAPAVGVWELHGWSHVQGSRAVTKKG